MFWPNKPTEKCPRTGVYCSLCNVNGMECMAYAAYNVILNQFYPHIQSLPIGRESLLIQRNIQTIICRHVTKRAKRIKRELQMMERETQ